MSKLPKPSDILESGGFPGYIDRILASPDYGESFAALCMDASRLALCFANSKLARKGWKESYTVGRKAVLSKTATQMNQLMSWFEEIAAKCPGTRDRLICSELLTKLTGSGTCGRGDCKYASSSLRTGERHRRKPQERYGQNHQTER